MKVLTFLTLMCVASAIVADTKITPPDLDLGHWVMTIDNSSLTDQATASLPEGSAEEARARAMMEKFLPKTTEVDQCITKEVLADMEKSLNSSINQSAAERNCEIDVVENTGKKIVVITKCPKPEMVMTTTTNFISSRHYETIMESNVGGRVSETLTNAQWKSASCPENTAVTQDTLLGDVIEQQAQRQKQRVGNQAEREVNRTVDKQVNKAVENLFGRIFK